MRVCQVPQQRMLECKTLLTCAGAVADTPTPAYIDQISDEYAFAAAAMNATWVLDDALPPALSAAPGPAASAFQAEMLDTAPAGVPAPPSNVTFADGGRRLRSWC